MRIDSCAPKGLSKFNMLASAALAVMLAACSNSVERFADNPSSENPSDVDPVYTASVPKKRVTYAPSYESSGDDKIISRPLASAPLGSPSYANNTYRKRAYKQPIYSEPTVIDTGNATTIPKGGTVRVEQGMTLYSISRANGLTVGQLANANNIAPPYTVSTGRVLRIPGVAQAKAPKPSFASQEQEEFASDEPVKKASGGRHTVRGGETLFSLGRKYGVSPYAIADLNGLPHDQSLNVGQSLRMPGGTAKSIVSKVPTVEEPEEIATNEEPIETDDTEQSLSLKKPALDLDDEVPIAKPVLQQTEVDSAPTLGSMRWPVKGKIISEYGAKPNGLKNEGINIAVPEGTGVRAAESGVVAYAGNELKGYGNLVLIRHQGGWVTAYAHAKELFVKRGDIVKRGDVIAKAGQTGSVSSPQLHFEVRKGATAMDPLKFLASTTASN